MSMPKPGAPFYLRDRVRAEYVFKTVSGFSRGYEEQNGADLLRGEHSGLHHPAYLHPIHSSTPTALPPEGRGADETARSLNSPASKRFRKARMTQLLPPSGHPFRLPSLALPAEVSQTEWACALTSTCTVKCICKGLGA